jgi:hypothetical protein
MVIASPATVTVTKTRSGSVPGPQSSRKSSNVYTPSGTSRIAARSDASVRSRISSIAANSVSRP